MYPPFLLCSISEIFNSDYSYLTSINFILTFAFLQAETQLLIPENDAVPSPPEDQLGLDTQPTAKTAFLLSIDVFGLAQMCESCLWARSSRLSTLLYFSHARSLCRNTFFRLVHMLLYYSFELMILMQPFVLSTV